MACPKCGSDDWKMASVIHAGGLSGISTSTAGFGVGTGGLGVGVADTIGIQQTLLSELAAPPKAPENLGCSVQMLGISIIIISLFLDEGLNIFYFGLFIFFSSVVFLINQKSLNKAYKEQLLEYQRTKMCLRCGTFFLGSNDSSCSFNDDGTITFKTVQNNEQKKRNFQTVKSPDEKMKEKVKTEPLFQDPGLSAITKLFKWK